MKLTFTPSPSAWPRAVAACWLAGLAPLANAATDPYAGATVDTTASHYTLTCGTCPITSANDDTGHQGGPGAASASYSAAAPGWAVAATAKLDGPNGLPTLGGFGFADLVTDPVPTTFLYKAGAFSQGLQRYDYSGTAPTTYKIDFDLTGSFTLGRADAASLMSVMGGYTVYGADYNPLGEFRGTVLGTQFVNARASVAGLQNFSLPGSISFTVNPGDAFYVWGALSVTSDASHQIVGTVDASHTLGAQFTAGDTALLSPAIAAAVPEAPAPLLMLGGLATLLWLRRRNAAREA
jgi:hypothetical protein